MWGISEYWSNKEVISSTGTSLAADDGGSRLSSHQAGWRAHLKCQLAVQIALVLRVQRGAVDDMVERLAKPVLAQLGDGVCERRAVVSRRQRPCRQLMGGVMIRARQNYMIEGGSRVSE